MRTLRKEAARLFFSANSTELTLMNVSGSANSIKYQAYSFTQEALIYRYWGFSVFPVGREKKPLVSWKPYQRRRPHDCVLGTLFGNAKVTGLAVVLGEISQGLAVRDFDTVESYLDWEKAHPELAKRLPTVRTRRGFHVFCRLTKPSFAKWDDGELRGNSSTSFCFRQASFQTAAIMNGSIIFFRSV